MSNQDATDKLDGEYLRAEPDEALLRIAHELSRLNNNIERLTYRDCPSAQPHLSVQIELSAASIQKLARLLHRT